MDENQARHTALDMAIRETPGGTKWAQIIELANIFAAYIINGTVPTDENAEAK
ncbi:hypothetical protein [Arthrobacter glacialis]|uniref:hypothetical protein n=1 Tax=Arthrobacter glacialis TaxID=1664 RepID=UPI0013FDD7CD|nr:hypothetical protein [Arthrobacter glacialis]